MIKVAVIFDQFGPYHIARLVAAGSLVDIVAIEVFAKSSDYAWGPQKSPVSLFRKTLVSEAEHRHVGMSRSAIRKRLFSVLDEFRPDAVAVPGWASIASFAAIAWCLRRNVSVIMLSESSQWDARRHLVTEWVKSQVVKSCGSALVGGSPHVRYICSLGMPEDLVFRGYDVVDNQYFSNGALAVRAMSRKYRRTFKLPERYFLASARFVPKKNLSRLIEAYHLYRGHIVENGNALADEPFYLVLLGDGDERTVLQELVRQLKIQPHVIMPGFIRYEDLPVYYALSQAFVHASTVEQWGLVINEAMASGLPVIVSNRCGSAEDLVKQGVNGLLFNPESVDALASAMYEMHMRGSAFRASMGVESQMTIKLWNTDRFAEGLFAAASAAQDRHGSYGVLSKTLINFISIFG